MPLPSLQIRSLAYFNTSKLNHIKIPERGEVCSLIYMKMEIMEKSFKTTYCAVAVKIKTINPYKYIGFVNMMDF